MSLFFKAGVLSSFVFPSISFAHPCNTDVLFQEAPIYTHSILNSESKQQTFTFMATVKWTEGKYKTGGNTRIQLDPSCDKEIQALVEKNYLEQERIRGNKKPDYKSYAGDWVVSLEDLPKHCQMFNIVEGASTCSDCRIVKTKTLGEKLIHCDHEAEAASNQNHAEPYQQSSSTKTNKTGISTESAKTRNDPSPKENPTLQGK